MVFPDHSHFFKNHYKFKSYKFSSSWRHTKQTEAMLGLNKETAPIHFLIYSLFIQIITKANIKASQVHGEVDVFGIYLQVFY